MLIATNIENLLNKNTIESNRIEYKEGWNPTSIYRTICAFANDFDDLGGGYIIVGVREVNGVVERPVLGVNEDQLDRIQKEMLGFNNLIYPVYYPKVSIEDVDNRKLLVIWVPGGANRPYKVPDDVNAKVKTSNYYIRYNTSSIVAKDQHEKDLIGLCNQVPFDDRINHSASSEDISYVLLRDYLVAVKSKLASSIESVKLSDILQQMDLVSGEGEMQRLKNIALMMFCNRPDKFFPSTQVDIVIYPKGKENDPSNLIEIPPIFGPVNKIIKDVMLYLRTNIIYEKISKPSDNEESIKYFNYPYQALEEAVVNALYHRDYQEREPIEINIEPQNIEIISYSGPNRSIRIEDLRKGKIKARRYRNRKLGDFLKELRLTEGRGTGVPTIIKELKDNGSPAAIFDTDEDRSYFYISIPCHLNCIEDTLKINGVTQLDVDDIGDIQTDVFVSLCNIFMPKSIYILELLSQNGAMDKVSIFSALNVSNQTYSKKKYLDPLLNNDCIDMVIKNKPNSRNQKYHITDMGMNFLKAYKRR